MKEKRLRSGTVLPTRAMFVCMVGDSTLALAAVARLSACHHWRCSANIRRPEEARDWREGVEHVLPTYL